MKEYWEECWSHEDRAELAGYLKGFNHAQSQVITYFLNHSVQKVCDAACGFGAYSLLMFSHGLNVRGFDVSETSVNITKELLRPYGIDENCFITSSITHTPYPDSCFDAVTAHAVIDHLTKEDAKAAVQELTRIIRNDGYLYLSFDELDEDDLQAEHETLEDGSFIYTDEERKGLLFLYYTQDMIDQLLANQNIVLYVTDKRGNRNVIIQIKKAN